MPPIIKFSPRKQYLRLQFTLNVDEWRTIDLSELIERSSYLVAGKETATTGQKHWQGYVEFPRKVLGSMVQGLLPGAHWEKAIGSAHQNLVYCTKEDAGSAIQTGTPHAGQGARTDIGDLFEAVRNGASELEIADAAPAQWLQYRRGLERYRNLVSKPQDKHPEVIYIWGPTGTGKTRQAFQDGAEFVTYRSPYMMGYTGQNRVLVLDDFDWRAMPISVALRLTDRYPYKVRDCGIADLEWSMDRLYITSNEDPKMIWPEALAEHRKAFMRRVTTVIHLTERQGHPLVPFWQRSGGGGEGQTAPADQSRSPSPRMSQRSDYSLRAELERSEEDPDVCNKCNLRYYPENQEGRCLC